MDHIKAKSEKFGGETLAQHTWDVLAKLAELRHLRSDLPQQVGLPRLWHCLFWACLLHDFGKAARGFQNRLAGGTAWNQRHEVLSLAFLDWIVGGLSDDEQTWILAAIVSHHRDSQYIAEVYADVTPDPLEKLLAELDAATVVHLWRWVSVCGEAWRDALGFSSDEVAPISLLEQDVAVANVCDKGVQRVRRWLYRYADWVDDIQNDPAQRPVIGILLRGLTTSADHMASAHLTEMPAPVQEPWYAFAERLLAAIRVTKPDADLYEHQRVSAAAAGGSAILIAPTGSAKTESGLFWALGDGSAPMPRLFYALPYQASMNAMYDRLRDETRGFGEEAVGIQHGRALQAMYARLLASERWSATAASAARWQKNINTLNARPIKVFSPYQMLKALFQIRGFEAMLTDYMGAAFIFDEIHAYEPARLALILTLVRYLREQYSARFFVMSATFPALIREKLRWALGDYTTIRADGAVFTAFTRHRLRLLDGDLLDSLDTVVADLRIGKQVLVCVNTVRRAQEVRNRLTQLGVANEQMVLIHSRFIIKDRTLREEEVRTRSALDCVERTPFILIATQVVEVSLNIDLDTIYSDPAPLEALLQRFGRVNRSCKKGICPVHVFREPNDGQGVYGRSKNRDEQGHIVRVTLAELEQHDGTIIDEAAINDWIDHIYDDPHLKAVWQAEYTRIASQAELYIRTLLPFNSSEQKEDEFEQMFDGVDVLPMCYERRYLDLIATHAYLDASQYFVSISRARYARLGREGRIRQIADPEGHLKGKRWMVDVPYTNENGLQFDAPVDDQDWS
jgi:CRISPR-associated endonuclease/helicase Cas3